MAMGFLLHVKSSTDVNFVIVKDVTAAKYRVSYASSCNHISTVSGVVSYTIVLHSV
jgi:hypothetical protein